MRKGPLWILITSLLILMGGWVLSSFLTPDVHFNEDVRPILNEHCLPCHGGVKQLGGLSFLFETEAKAQLESEGYAIVPGKARRSLVLDRLRHADPELRMPPDGPPLPEKDIRTIERWIKQGAKWQTHWSYRALPDIGSFSYAEIDGFIEHKLNEIGLAPSSAANRQTLLRRVSLDLIGLPPTWEEVQDFVTDQDPDAYEKQIDRLLDLPQFGERWAALWMDLARYGDSQGYQKDPYRSIWRYRDWLIDAFNRDLPFDQFTIQQLAGDLLEDPSEEELLATAFHRNTMTNDEGGTDDEEFRVAAVLDRVNTTWEVWQGSSMACVQCHSHPYDPFVHQDYYNLFAFFNTTSDADKRNDAPLIYTYGKAEEHLIKRVAETHGIEIEQGNDGTRELDELRDKLMSLPQISSAEMEELEQVEKVPTPIMEDLPPDSTRASFLFERGNWLVHGEQVFPNVPQSMPSIGKVENANRLDLAKWLVSDRNPLTARVMVNRFWASFFGRGLVATLEDFGTMGDAPSHPELLDWLAVYFKDEVNWSMKSLIKKMVMSGTYQRSSITSDRQLELDPQNIYLSRMPRRRLTAEQIRDQALAVSGLLSVKMFGPSVMPPQPDGVWQVIRNVMQWKESEGEDRYRRALYTFWRKSSPYPSFITFDSPSKEFCLSRRIPTNTPLQALVTLNDTVYVEAAKSLAKLSVERNPSSIQQAIRELYQRAVQKDLDAKTLAVLMRQYQTGKELLQQTNDGFEASDLSDMVDLEALTAVANVVMNLDEYLVIE